MPFREVALTPREHQVLMLTIQGLSDASIAEELGISAVTVRTYMLRLSVLARIPQHLTYL